MNEHDDENDLYEDEEEDAQFAMDIIGMLKKIQQQLGYLEKKIDTLVNQSQGRPPRERHFSKPFRPGQPREQGSEQGQREWRPRRDRGHDNRRHDDNRGFAPKKKSYYGKRGR
jgi:hypothetical protein